MILDYRAVYPERRKKMFKEFKEFAMRGSVIDMAVGIVIGAAFGTIVNSFVSDIIMPPIGIILGKVDFSSLFIVLKEGKVAGHTILLPLPRLLVLFQSTTVYS